MSAVRQLGWLDTNLFIHALFPRDPHYPRCQELLRALADDFPDVENTFHG